MSIEKFYESLKGDYHSQAFRFRAFILTNFIGITEEYKWRLPYFYYKGKGICYFHSNERNGLYLGFAKGHQLIDEKNLLEGENLTVIKHYRFKDVHFQEEELRSFIIQSIDIIDAELERKNNKKKTKF